MCKGATTPHVPVDPLWSHNLGLPVACFRFHVDYADPFPVMKACVCVLRNMCFVYSSPYEQQGYIGQCDRYHSSQNNVGPVILAWQLHWKGGQKFDCVCACSFLYFRRVYVLVHVCCVCSVKSMMQAPGQMGCSLVQPGLTTGLTVEQKRHLLWGKKKQEPVKEPTAQPVAAFGANRWDVAEFSSGQEKEKFQRLMVSTGWALMTS